MRILVTGGAGFLGSILVPRLLEKAHEVVVIDNFRYNQASLLDSCHQKGLTLIRGDCRNEKLLGKGLEGADFIIPLAAIVGIGACDSNPAEAQSVNFKAIRLLLKMREAGQKIIYPATNSGYGVGADDKYCNEDSPLKPQSVYAKSKVIAERFVIRAGNYITLRLATVFGISPRMRTDLLVNDFVYRAITDGSVVLFEQKFKRNFIYIGDVARAFIHCIDNWEEMKNQTYNVGLSDANLTKEELCWHIGKQLPLFTYQKSSSLFQAGDPDKRDYMVSNAKIEATGFKPKTSLADGIAELIKGYQVIRKNQYSNL